MISNSVVEDLKGVLVDTLGFKIELPRSRRPPRCWVAFPNLTRWLAELAQALEDQFGFDIDDSEFTGDTFETVGSLAEFIERKQAEQ